MHFSASSSHAEMQTPTMLRLTVQADVSREVIVRNGGVKIMVISSLSNH